MPATYNPKINDFSATFNNISTNGENKKYDGCANANIAVNHIQGMAYWRNYVVFSHNQTGSSKGQMVITNTETNKRVHLLDVDVTNRNHPGGIQFIGDYLCMAVEDLTKDISKIIFYDFSQVNDSTPPTMLEFSSIDRPNKRSSGVGIANSTSNEGKEYYIVAVNDNDVVDVYYSNDKPIDDRDCSFGDCVQTFKLKEDASEICLVTDTQNKTYIVAFSGLSHLGSYKDVAYCYSINGDYIGETHFITHHGATLGNAGEHFRWGAGLQILTFPDKDPKLMLYCSQRNFVAGSTWINNFYPK